MFRRREGRTAYPRERTIRVLAWLARDMLARSETVFLLEQLQPSAIPRGRWRFGYFVASRALIGMYFATMLLDSIGAALQTFVSVTLPLAYVDYRAARTPTPTPARFATLKNIALLVVLM